MMKSDGERRGSRAERRAHFREKVKKVVFHGGAKENGLVMKLVVYALLIGIGFIYLYPILYMLVSAFMNLDDLVNPAVNWMPTQLYLGNFRRATRVLDFFNTLRMSVFAASVPAVLQTIVCALAGYAFARFEFPLKRMWLFLVVATFIIPVQVTIVPRYILLHSYGLIGSLNANFLPAAFGQGFRSTIFVLIFYNFFKTYPKSLDEAAIVDGASKLRVFVRIALPISVPAIIVSILFSFIWYWNETYQTSLFVGTGFMTMPVRLESFVTEFNRLYPATDGSPVNRINEALRMAGTLLAIAPLLLLYLCTQKQFVESVETTGITGE